MRSEAEFRSLGGDGDPQATVDERLAALGPGLTASLIAEAVDRAVTRRNGVSALAPIWFEGSTLNAETVANVMELLIPLGWRRWEEKGFCAVVSPDGSTRIAVATGDTRTGGDEFGAMPKTKNSRGAITERAIMINTNPTLFDDAAGADGEPEIQRTVTWILLIAVVRREVRMEVSRPQGQDKLGRISDWSVRIPLDPIPANNAVGIVDDQDGDDDVEIDIDIQRREG